MNPNNSDQYQKKGWRIQLSVTGRDQLQSQLASYLGHFKHARYHRLLKRMLQRFCWLTCLFNLSQCRLFPLWKPVRVSSYANQQHYFQSTFPTAMLCIQKGYQQLQIPPKQPPAVTNTDDFSKTSIRLQIRRVVVEQQGYLPGGMRERCVSQIFINPGVLLCLN